MLTALLLLGSVALARSTCIPGQGNSVNGGNVVRYTIEELTDFEGADFSTGFGALKSSGELRSELSNKRAEIKEKLSIAKQKGKKDKVKKLKAKKQGIDDLLAEANNFNAVANLLEGIDSLAHVSQCYHGLIEEIAAAVDTCQQGNDYKNCLVALSDSRAEKCEVMPGSQTGVYCALGLRNEFVREYIGQLFVDMQIVGVEGNMEKCKEEVGGDNNFHFDMQALKETDMGVNDVPTLPALFEEYEETRADLKSKIKKAKKKDQDSKVQRFKAQRSALGDAIEFLGTYGDDFLIENLPEQLFINVLTYRCRMDLLSKAKTCLTNNINTVEGARSCEFRGGSSGSRGTIFYTVGCSVGLKNDTLHFPQVTIAKRL